MPIKAKKLCDMHLQRFYRTGEAGSAYKYTGLIKSKKNTNTKSVLKTKACNAAGCKEVGVRLGFCQEHLEKFELM